MSKISHIRSVVVKALIVIVILLVISSFIVPIKDNASASQRVITLRNGDIASQLKGAATYRVKGTFDLDGDTITIPEGSILEFIGGTLRNGAIKGKDVKAKLS